jgi:superoxide dismutase, Fe-Mn family
MAVYTLPELSYDYAALEPAISGQIMQLHHDKHHKTYVDGANTALEGLAAAREKNEFPTINQLQKNLAFNLAGHVNHTVFWENLSPDGGDNPVGELAQAVEEFFGGADQLRAQFSAAALGIQGSGWAILAWDALGQRLIIEQLYDHQGNLAASTVPLLMLDMWEHAFYLDYKNVKADYVKAYWNIVNWADVAERFEKARTQTPGLITKVS